MMRVASRRSFNSFIVEVFNRMSDMPESSAAVIRQDIDNRSMPAYTPEVQKAVYAALAPNDTLTATRDLLQELTSHIQWCTFVRREMEAWVTAKENLEGNGMPSWNFRFERDTQEDANYQS